MARVLRAGLVVAVGLLAAGCQGTVEQAQSVGSAQKEQQAFRFQALKMFVEVDSDDTGGAVATVRVFVPPGAGAAPHVHSREDEVFVVVRGHYRFRHGDHEIDAPAGTTVYMPKGIPHVFRNVGTEPGEHILTLIPGGLEKMFREVSAEGLQAPKDSARLAEIGAKYGLTILPPSALPLSEGR